MPDTVSPLARTVTHTLASLPIAPPAFSAKLVQAVLDTDDETTTHVLDELTRHGIVDAGSDGTYTLADAVTAPTPRDRPDPDAIEAAATWFINERLLPAEQARDRHARRISPDYDAITPMFCTPADALSWYEAHHKWYTDLLIDLSRLHCHELVVKLAEAVFGLAGHLGHHRNQVYAVEEALRALDSLQDYWFGLVDERDEEDTAVRAHHVRVARFQLMMASVQTNLRDFGAALRALGEAERRGRDADSSRVLAAVCRSRGRVHHATGDLSEAERQLRAAQVIDSYRGDLRLMALSLRRRGEVLADMGDYDQAGLLLHEAAIYAVEGGNRIAQARVLTSTGALHVVSGQRQKAIEVLGRALEIMEQQEAGCPRYLADIYRHLAYASRADDRAVADQDLRRAVEYYRLAHDEHTASALEDEWRQRDVAA
ncbi:tetratricopeptide repeat protein [Lentzea sp. NPDC042327]|uniref:tetratricopeptide repeat protein n=1 Tax=Lentzea sp. NPDC042327 TaxID=3154801 RepID=UPI0033FF50F0